MAYGMRIWGADGALQLDENSFTMRVVLSTIVTFSGGKEIKEFSVPGCTASNSVAVCVPIGSYQTNVSGVYQFETEMADNVARVYNYLRNYPSGIQANGTPGQRLLVIRFA